MGRRYRPGTGHGAPPPRCGRGPCPRGRPLAPGRAGHAGRVALRPRDRGRADSRAGAARRARQPAVEPARLRRVAAPGRRTAAARAGRAGSRSPTSRSCSAAWPAGRRPRPSGWAASPTAAPRLAAAGSPDRQLRGCSPPRPGATPAARPGGDPAGAAAGAGPSGSRPSLRPAAWAVAGSALFVARELFVAGGRLPAVAEASARRLLGPGAPDGDVAGRIRHPRAPPGAGGGRRACGGGPRRCGAPRPAGGRGWTPTPAALLRRPRFSRDPVVGAVGVAAVDAWRVCAALECAARGGRDTRGVRCRGMTAPSRCACSGSPSSRRAGPALRAAPGRRRRHRRAGRPADATPAPGSAGQRLARLHARPRRHPRLSPVPRTWTRLEREGRADLLAGEAQLEDGPRPRSSGGDVAAHGRLDADRRRAAAARPPGRDRCRASCRCPGRRATIRPRCCARDAGRRPFAPLIDTYATVPYADVDPNVLAGLAYVVMFGMMFADAGQGAVLAPRLAGARLGPAAAAGRTPAELAVPRRGGRGELRLRRPLRGVLRAHRSPRRCAGSPARRAGAAAGRAVWGWARSCSRAPTRSARSTAGARAAGGWRCTPPPGWPVPGVPGPRSRRRRLVLEIGWLLATGVVVAVAALVLTFVGLLADAGGGAAGVGQAAIELFDVVVRLGSNLVSFARLAAFGLTHAALALVVWQATTALWGNGGSRRSARCSCSSSATRSPSPWRAGRRGAGAAAGVLRTVLPGLLRRGPSVRPWHVPVLEGPPHDLVATVPALALVIAGTHWLTRRWGRRALRLVLAVDGVLMIAALVLLVLVLTGHPAVADRAPPRPRAPATRPPTGARSSARRSPSPARRSAPRSRSPTPGRPPWPR